MAICIFGAIVEVLKVFVESTCWLHIQRRPPQIHLLHLHQDLLSVTFLLTVGKEKLAVVLTVLLEYAFGGNAVNWILLFVAKTDTIVAPMIIQFVTQVGTCALRSVISLLSLDIQLWMPMNAKTLNCPFNFSS